MCSVARKVHMQPGWVLFGGGVSHVVSSGMSYAMSHARGPRIKSLWVSYAQALTAKQR